MHLQRFVVADEFSASLKAFDEVVHLYLVHAAIFS